MFFKERFESLAVFQKIEIVLIILMVYSGVLYYVDNFYKFNMDGLKEQKQAPKNINIEDKIDPFTQSEALQYIQDKLLYVKIENSSVILQNVQQISLEFVSSYTKSFELLTTLEKHFQIVYLSIIPQGELLEIQMVLDTRYMFNKDEKREQKSSFENPFYYKKELVEVQTQKEDESFQIPKYQIDGILGDEVLINAQWYIKGDVIGSNKIVEIKNDRVSFQNTINQKQFDIKYNK